MPEADPPNENDLSVHANVTSTGFMAGIRSRFASALDRRAGRKVDEGGFSREARLALGEQRLKHELAVRERVFEAGVAGLEGDPKLLHQAGQRMIGTLLQEEENLNATFEATERHIALIADARPKNDESAPDNAELDPDYVTAWLRFAKDAGADRKRDMFGRLLASEVVTPSDASISTLRILAELTPYDAKAFERLLPNCFGRRLIARPEWGGFELIEDDLLIAQECGLLMDHTRDLYTKVTSAASRSCLFIDGHRALEVSLNDVGQTVQVQGIGLTRAGRELAAVLDYDERPLFRSVLQKNSSVIEWAVSGKLVKVENKYRIDDTTRELLWPLPQSDTP